MLVSCRFVISVFAVCLLFLLSGVNGAQAPHRRPGSQETLWSGQAGSYRWKWTTSDLTAQSLSTGQAVFSAAAYEKRTNSMLQESKDEPYETYLECTLQPLSVVGSIASYERDYYWEGGAHPSGSIDFMSVDVTNPRRRLSLVDVFPESVVLQALLADKIVRETLRRNHTAGRPKNTSQLVKLLNGKSFGGDNNDEFAFSEDLLSRFAFHHIENGQVAVRLNVSWNIEVYRFQTTQIGILLPIPARLRSAMTLAASQKQGFLMRDAKTLASGRTTFLFAQGKKPQ